jgi:hypothetical protein
MDVGTRTHERLLRRVCLSENLLDAAAQPLPIRALGGGAGSNGWIGEE